MSDGSVRPGTELGSYRIEAVLGEGGMGIVYRAFDMRLQRPVAIKLLSDQLADARARHRFQREAQTASSLNHPHILTVHDVGDHNGRQYIVSEFVDGGTLREWIWETPALPGPARRLVQAMAPGDLSHDGSRMSFFQFRDGAPELVVSARDGSADRVVARLPVGAYSNLRWSPDSRRRTNCVVTVRPCTFRPRPSTC